MKVMLKGYVHKCQYSGTFEVRSCDMSKYGDIFVGEVEFEYEVPADFNPIKAQVDALNQQIDALTDEFHKRKSAFQSRINDLLCLEAPKDVA